MLKKRQDAKKKTGKDSVCLCKTKMNPPLSVLSPDCVLSRDPKCCAGAKSNKGGCKQSAMRLKGGLRV